MEENDIKAPSDCGFDDKAILQINLIANYYNCVNRRADNLGFELENYWSVRF
jgi:hypothetical protein